MQKKWQMSQEWTSYHNKPNEQMLCLVFGRFAPSDTHAIHIGCMVKKTWFSKDLRVIQDVTHWMYLPSKPDLGDLYPVETMKEGMRVQDL